MESKTPHFRICPARSDLEVNMAASLIRDYTNSLQMDLSYQGFSTEMENLSTYYGPPQGELLVAYGLGPRDAALGCVALRPLKQHLNQEIEQNPEKQTNSCEMKRLYVSPKARGMGLGEILLKAIIHKARELGYTEMVLDTLPSMEGALRLYRRTGFVGTQAYYNTPVNQTVFLKLDLLKDAEL
ncbi:putative GNAT family acetyltransferase [Ilyonectria robusta]|uniref:putative GNAT family acetyltransferase n=1 Tax=Ilyonectria robusta TaxID=1079257 RepID=UPI001E8E7FCB|nr:putative GNAT family acetyltransferase [Ilyonectria robusta]KAH8685051.1 putative GNAT family acetyltransferase [Ilyonectria robusta]